ncbi:MAG: hypothetical protein QM699_10140 [Amaricoccus sp.]|uniref:hypothetical protein n=1 Tax=Amaricoccus sp. TaxID=1872485 RepID=UPI0039E3B6F3
MTENKRGIEIATSIAEMVRASIKEVTGLNASAGISYNKFPSQDGERPQQAERPGDHHPGPRAGLRRGAAGREIPRRRTGDLLPWNRTSGAAASAA